MNPLHSPLSSPSSGPDPLSAVASVPGPLWLDGLRQAALARTTWLWHGYLAAGNLTLLIGQWKAGKTTLLAVLLARLKAGGLLAGLPLAAGKAAVVSEESVVRQEVSSVAHPPLSSSVGAMRPFRGNGRRVVPSRPPPIRVERAA